MSHQCANIHEEPRRRCQIDESSNLWRDLDLDNMYNGWRSDALATRDDEELNTLARMLAGKRPILM